MMGLDLGALNNKSKTCFHGDILRFVVVSKIKDITAVLYDSNYVNCLIVLLILHFTVILSLFIVA